MIRLTEVISVNAENAFASFGPFPGELDSINFIYMNLFQLNEAFAEILLAASITEEPGTTSDEVLGGDPLLGSSLSQLIVNIGGPITSGIRFGSIQIPIFARGMTGRFISMRISAVSDILRGWIGVGR